MFEREMIDRLLKSANIVDVVRHYLPNSLVKKGKNYAAVCPFHDDHDPSLSINVELQIYKCFVCGHGGNAIRFVQEYEKCSFVEAVRKTAEIVGFHDPALAQGIQVTVDPEKRKLMDCISDLNSFYRYSLMTNEGAAAREYLETRGLTLADAEEFLIGYAPADSSKAIAFLKKKGHSIKAMEDIGAVMVSESGMKDRYAGRITFALKDENGQVIGFSARQLIKDDSTGKYVNSPETKLFHKSSVLYHYDAVKECARREGACYVLEGFMDVIALCKAGIPNAVALMGTAFTDRHLEMLRKLNAEILLCLDGDQAGEMGMMKALSKLSKEKVPVRVVDYQGDPRDPDDILRDDGPEALRKRMSTLLEPLDFQLSYYLSVKNVSSSEDKSAIIRHFLPILASEDGVLREDHMAKLSAALHFDQSALRIMVENEASKKTDVPLDSIRFSKGTAPRASAPMLKRLTRRLANAEDTILYYLLSSQDARDYVKEKGNPVYSALQRRIVYFILEYAKDRNDVDISGLLAFIGTDSDPESKECEKAVLNLLGKASNALPYSERLMEDCSRIISEEKQASGEGRIASRALENGDGQAAIEAINVMAKKRREKWAKEKNK